MLFAKRCHAVTIPSPYHRHCIALDLNPSAAVFLSNTCRPFLFPSGVSVSESWLHHQPQPPPLLPTSTTQPAPQGSPFHKDVMKSSHTATAINTSEEPFAEANRIWDAIPQEARYAFSCFLKYPTPPNSPRRTSRSPCRTRPPSSTTSPPGDPTRATYDIADLHRKLVKHLLRCSSIMIL